MKKFVFIFFFAVMVIASHQPAMAETILYVPQDNRPVSLDYVVDTAKAADLDIIIPPASLLANRTSHGNPDGLWQWLLANSGQADAIVASGDALIYGGLVPSRIHTFSEDVLVGRLANFKMLKSLNPSAKLYVFSTVMRSPKASFGGVEPDYYEQYGPNIFKITSLQDKKEQTGLSGKEKRTLKELLDSVPADFLADWLGRRAKNYRINEGLIAAVKAGQIDYLLLGRDDYWPYSQSNKEARQLTQAAADLPIGKFASFPGADQLGMVLVARAANDCRFDIPIVAVRYAGGAGPKTVPSYEGKAVGDTIIQHIMAAGGVPLPSPLSPDLVLAVNTPANGRTLEAGTAANKAADSRHTLDFINLVDSELKAGKKVAVADIAFANGSDNTLMRYMAKDNYFPRLEAYSGWNTSSNTVGYAVAQGMLASRMTPEAKKRLLATRLLDDWAYQANIRAEVANEVLYPQGGNYFRLDEMAPRITEETKNRINRFIQTNLIGLGLERAEVTIPWNRMFEIKVEPVFSNE